jgi:hypothetical protein
LNGDYFDFVTLRDGALAIAIGDVSGHGLGQAMIMAQTRAYLRSMARAHDDGRLLLIGTTNLDAQTPVIWNIGTIAKSGHPKALDLVRRILLAAGSTMEDILDVTVFLVDMDRDFAAYNAVYAELIGPYGPTRTTVAITALPTPIAVELKVIAAARPR